jgi:hypothetical protein
MVALAMNPAQFLLASVGQAWGLLVRWHLFLLCVVLPTAVAVSYHGFIASDVYVSQSLFVVRSPERQSASPLGMLFNLSVLSLSYNRLPELPSFLWGLERMREFNVDNNQLEYIPKEIVAFSGLVTLKFHGNMLQRVEPILKSARRDDLSIKLGRGVEIVVIKIQPGVFQTPRLRRRQHSQGDAGLHSQRVNPGDHRKYLI